MKAGAPWLAITALVALGCSHQPSAIESPRSPPVDAPAGDEDVAAPDEAAATVPEKSGAVPPAGLLARIEGTGAARQVVVEHPGHLLMIRSASAREGGVGKARSVATEKHLAWESTDLTTLDTFRGTLELTEGEKVIVEGGAEAPAVRSIEGNLHTCRAHWGSDDELAVVCRLAAGAWRAGAVSLMAEKPGDDVVLLASGQGTYVRVDIPLRGGETATGLVGYVEGALGVVIRAEVSKLPEEGSPTVALVSASRPQPAARFPRPPPHFHRHPFPPNIDVTF